MGAILPGRALSDLTVPLQLQPVTSQRKKEEKGVRVWVVGREGPKAYAIPMKKNTHQSQRLHQTVTNLC
jgi:hypothetical protein